MLLLTERNMPNYFEFYQCLSGDYIVFMKYFVGVKKNYLVSIFK